MAEMRRAFTAPPITVQDLTDGPTSEAKIPDLDDDPLSTEDGHSGGPQARKAYYRKHKRKPNLNWKKEWPSDGWKGGRVLVIDFISSNYSPSGRRKIIAQEFHELSKLQEFYADPERQSDQPGLVLRIIHVQNAVWARRYLLRKFNINHRDDLVGTAFGKWAEFERPQRRGGKPLLNGKTFRVQRDPWRGISRCAFGLDYLRPVPAKRGASEDADDFKMMEMNAYGPDENPQYSYDVYVQRLSVYIQRNEGDVIMPDEDLESPYASPNRGDASDGESRPHRPGPYGDEDYFPDVNRLDNGSVIIVFEGSQSGSCEDTLIGARQEIESSWSGLTFFLPRNDEDDDQLLTLDSMDLVLNDIFNAIAANWDHFLTKCETHVSILEDKVYENPADESRAPELWKNSSIWLKVEKLMFVHIDIIKELKGELKELADDVPSRQEFIETVPDNFDKLANWVQEDLVKPTQNLSDLMYKSVEIRDSRFSLHLNTSLWRLSWITFIFLPLTFVVGFFGMNVDTFEDNPSVKWYFIVSAPLILLIFLLWYIFKHSPSSLRVPIRRGTYENLYHEISCEYPSLWSRSGARVDSVEPVGLTSTIKWNLIVRWFAPKYTVLAPAYDPDSGGLSVWQRTKNSLLRRWLPEIQIRPSTTHGSELADIEHSAGSTDGTVGGLLSLSAPIAVGASGPESAERVRRSIFRSKRFGSSRSRSNREGSSYNNGIMVTEEKSEEEAEAEEEERRKGRRIPQRTRSSSQRSSVAGASEGSDGQREDRGKFMLNVPMNRTRS